MSQSDKNRVLSLCLLGWAAPLLLVVLYYAIPIYKVFRTSSKLIIFIIQNCIIVTAESHLLRGVIGCLEKSFHQLLLMFDCDNDIFQLNCFHDIIIWFDVQKPLKYTKITSSCMYKLFGIAAEEQFGVLD